MRGTISATLSLTLFMCERPILRRAGICSIARTSYASIGSSMVRTSALVYGSPVIIIRARASLASPFLSFNGIRRTTRRIASSFSSSDAGGITPRMICRSR